MPNEACLVDRRRVSVRSFRSGVQYQGQGCYKETSQTSLSPSLSPSPSLLTICTILSLHPVVAGYSCRRISLTVVSLYCSKTPMFPLPYVATILILLVPNRRNCVLVLSNQISKNGSSWDRLPLAFPRTCK